MSKTREEYNLYMRRYMLKRYHRRMSEAKAALGGKCCRCGSVKQLEIDHVKPSRKNYTLGKVLASLSEEKFQRELKLCQLLCAICHDKKSCEDRGMQYVRDGSVHGTLSSYRYCRCRRCLDAFNAWSRQYRKESRARDAAASVTNF